MRPAAETPTRAPFGDYLVFVDETGDHGLDHIDRDFPLFGLSFCIFAKPDYVERVTPAVRALKIRTFGHDLVILHEHDIRKKEGAFARLGREARETFMEELSRIIAEAPFTLIAVVLDKRTHKARNTEPGNPYHLAMEIALERLQQFLAGRQAERGLTHVVFEARGKREDELLELEFRRVCAHERPGRTPYAFEIVLADKKANSEGLQLADLTARPVALSILRPGQPNRALDVLQPKFHTDATGRKEGYGLNVVA